MPAGSARYLSAMPGAERFIRVGCMLLLVGVGCQDMRALIPDAAPNAAPSITSVAVGGAEQPPYSTVMLETGANAGTLSITAYDTDVGDTIFVSIFVNYNVPAATPPRSTGRASVTDSIIRTISVTMDGVCTSAEVGADPLPLLQVYVFDRQPLDNVEPLYQALAPGGLSVSQTFFLRCVPGM